MKNLAPVTAISLLFAVLFSGQAQALTFTESSDAGESLSTAQVIPLEPLPLLPLESISGSLTGDADLFQIYLTGGQTFSATTLNADTLIELPVDALLGNPTDILQDPQLFLFDSSGKGVYANNDFFGSPQATLPSGGFSPKDSGIYYLAISGSGYYPVSSQGRIFPDDSSTGVFGPTGSGGNFPLIGFAGTSDSNGRYTIALTGVQTSAKSVPEPGSTLALLGLGTWGAVSVVTNKKNSKKQAEHTSRIV